MRGTNKFSGMKDDILGAGMHLLQGAGGDLKLLVQQAVSRLLADNYVSREEYDRLAARVAELEGGKAKKPAKTAAKVKKPAAKTAAKKARK